MFRVARGNLGIFNCDIADLKWKSQNKSYEHSSSNRISVDCYYHLLFIRAFLGPPLEDVSIQGHASCMRKVFLIPERQ